MIKSQYPYKDNDGIVHNDKIKYYSDINHQVLQKETNRIFDYVIDDYPSKYTYDEAETFIEYSIIELEEKARAYDIIMGVSE